MSKEASSFCCIACLALGLLTGYLFMREREGRAAADTLAALTLKDLGESSERAQKAYEHAGVPVAIYAMTELLDKQKAVEEYGGNALISTQMISIDLILTHGRLAKLYGETGASNLCAQHVAEALRYAQSDRNLGVTNRDTLMDFVAKTDNAAK